MEPKHTEINRSLFIDFNGLWISIQILTVAEHIYNHNICVALCGHNGAIYLGKQMETYS